jgi:hypothetical protein
MRDPDLVQRAEQAATALEQAWMRWRTRHGLGSGPLPPVSSYVGYSVEEPWGQPRVVLGVEASEAERLAAMLDGHDCAGPGLADSAGLPEHRQPAELDLAPAGAIPDGQVAVAVQPSPHVPPQPAALVASSAPPEGTGGRPPGSVPPGGTGGRPPGSVLPGGTGGRPPGSAPPGDAEGPPPDTAATPAEPLGRIDSRLKDLAARVTALRPRPDAHDQHEPEATQSGLADTAV